MALMAVVLKPDDAETEEIFGAAMTRAAAALHSETHSVYHSPRRSSSFAASTVDGCFSCKPMRDGQKAASLRRRDPRPTVSMRVTIGFLIVFAIICYRGVFAMKRRTDPRVVRLI
ncbi:hypothetical protein YC2023_100712 [Brassica napus]